MKSKTKNKLDHLDRKLELVVHFRHQKIMAQGLPHLHDSHDGGINLILTVLKDSFCGAGLLLHLEEEKDKIIIKDRHQ